MGNQISGFFQAHYDPLECFDQSDPILPFYRDARSRVRYKRQVDQQWASAGKLENEHHKNANLPP